MSARQLWWAAQGRQASTLWCMEKKMARVLQREKQYPGLHLLTPSPVLLPEVLSCDKFPGGFLGVTFRFHLV